MVLLGVEVLVGFYVGSKTLEKYRAIKEEKTKEKSVRLNTFTVAAPEAEVRKTNQPIKKEGLEEAGASVAEAEKKADHYLKVSTASIGLVSISHFYSPLTLLSLSVFSYASLPIYKKVENSSFKERRINNDLLNAIVNFTCVATGQYFVAALAAFVYHFGGKTLAKAQGKSKEILTHVFELQPRSAWVLRDNVDVNVPLETVHVNDIVVVNTSEVVPIDGVIIDGQSMIDQHVLTGEFQPVEKSKGDKVFASTMLVAGKILVKVEQAGEETTISKIAQMLRHTTDFKSKAQLKGETWADQMAIPLLSIGLVTVPFVGLYGTAAILNSSPGNRIRILAPLETLSHLNLASRQGILIKDGRALEVLMKVDTILFDKTGTLTEEQPKVGKIVVCGNYTKNDILKYAGAAERKMTHPIAQAILKKAQESDLILPDIDDSKYQLGYGITVSIEGKIIRVGSARFMRNEGFMLSDKIAKAMTNAHNEGHSLVIVAIDDDIGGVIEIQPSVRPEVKNIISGLRKQGLQHLAIVSGDHQQPTQKLAEELGMDDFFYDVLPEHKANIVEQLQKKGRIVCFIGDGVNDTIAMKKANVSISLRGATSIATDTAQVVLMDGTLFHLCTLFDISKSLDSYLRKMLAITFFPVALIFGGAFILHFGVLTSIIINNAGLAAGIGYLTLPRKIENVIP
ncbi:MAG: heavy metal translocating P-type ATPase [Candidatus Parabeggiatoa sp.]|nr:heavy metal translocating P-type ATPase [Candidatus Parabeggiatoa sp.]